MKEAFIKLHLSILIAGGTGVFGRLISLNEGLLVWYRMMFASVMFFLLLSCLKKLRKVSFGDVAKIASVGLLLASQAKAERYRAENEKLRQKLEELRVVSRAKCLLVEYLHLDEESAHKYMERQAMEERKTRRAVAEEILREYG